MTNETSTTLSRIKERRLDKMRLGQNACEIVSLLSDPEIRIALVPLTEAEKIKGMDAAAALPVFETQVGLLRQEEEQKIHMLKAACREVDDLSEFVFQTVEDVKALQMVDINHLMDNYLEMEDAISPSVERLSDEEFAELKKAWDRINWNELTGRQLYAARRFLASLMAESPEVSFAGSSSTSNAM